MCEFFEVVFTLDFVAVMAAVRDEDEVFDMIETAHRSRRAHMEVYFAEQQAMRCDEHWKAVLRVEAVKIGWTMSISCQLENQHVSILRMTNCVNGERVELRCRGGDGWEIAIGRGFFQITSEVVDAQGWSDNQLKFLNWTGMFMSRISAFVRGDEFTGCVIEFIGRLKERAPRTYPVDAGTLVKSAHFPS